MFEYPKNIIDNKRYRLDVLQKAEQDKELRIALLEKSKLDLLFFLNTFGWTYNPKLDKPHIPFITYDFQDDFITSVVKDIEEERDIFVEKSREMGFSWMMVSLMVWGFIKGWSMLYGSYKQDYVDEQGNMDSHFERIRYFIERLPKFLLPSDMQTKYMSVNSKSTSGEISGDSGDNFGTGGRRKFVIHDEFPLWQCDQKAYRKTKDITNCRIFGGTPEGKSNVYGKVMTNHPDYRHLQMSKYTLHWSKHPLKTQEWYEQQKLTRTKLDIAKELDISYEASVTGAVYPEFNELVTFDDCQFNPNLKLYTSWDFGRDMNAVIWMQKDYTTNTLYIIDAYQKSKTDIDFFAPLVTGKQLVQYGYTQDEINIINRHKDWINNYAGHYGDPYNIDNTNTLSVNTIRKQLSNYDIHIKTRHDTGIQERIRKTTVGFRRLHVNKDLQEFITAIQQSRYPEVSENSQSTTEKVNPIHDFNSHFRTALEYLFDNEPVIDTNDKPLNYGYKTIADLNKSAIINVDSEIEQAITNINNGKLY